MDSSLKEINELTNAMCYIYPQEISQKRSNGNDQQLCMRILNKQPSNKIHNLDNLARFDKNVLTNYGIGLQVIDILYKNIIVPYIYLNASYYLVYYNFYMFLVYLLLVLDFVLVSKMVQILLQ